jgi:hypothetical protein
MIRLTRSKSQVIVILQASSFKVQTCYPEVRTLSTLPKETKYVKVIYLLHDVLQDDTI